MVARVLVTALCLAALVGCSKNDTNPNGAQPPVRESSEDGRLPDISRSAKVTLLNYANYSAVNEMFADPSFFVMPPLVGDPRLQLTLSQSGEMVTGSLLFLVEDDGGAMWMTQPSFDRTGHYGVENGQTVLDAIFQDDLVVTRIRGTVTGGVVSGQVHYRVRTQAAIDQRACRMRTFSCQQVGGDLPPWYVPDPRCQPGYTLDLVTECREFMDFSQSAVKSIGNFEPIPVTNWIGSF